MKHLFWLTVLACIGSAGCAAPQSNRLADISQRPPNTTLAAGPVALKRETPNSATTALTIPQHLATGATETVNTVTPVNFEAGGDRRNNTCVAGDCATSSCVTDTCAPETRVWGGGGSACAATSPTVIPHGYATTSQWVHPRAVDPQEFLCNGGDRRPAARVRRDDSIAGLGVSDTVVHYTTEASDIEVRSTNQVCLYAPRFKSVRKITGAVSGGHAIGLGGVRNELALNRIEINEGGVVIGDSVELGQADVAKRIDAMRDRNRGVPVESVLQPEQASDVLAALINLTLDQVSMLEEEEQALLEELSLAAVAWALDESVEVAVKDLKAPTITRDQSVEGFVLYEFPDAGRLQVSKLADRSDALPGEYVNFAISIQNVGDSPVDQVVITDNLTTRLEYVADSQTCSAGALFETATNDSLSLQLTWKLTDSLRVGESATIRFRCKVR